MKVTVMDRRDCGELGRQEIVNYSDGNIREIIVITYLFANFLLFNNHVLICVFASTSSFLDSLFPVF